MTGGHEKPLRLMKSNVDLMYSGIAVDKLPLLLRDLFNLAHDLGHAYIWIDVLCIQQDDADDWNIQANQMHRIYTHSNLNLSVCRSLHDESLYHEREVLLLVDLNIEIVLGAERKALGDIWTGRTLEDCSRTEPLLHRGWVYQELILAPRNVFFGGQQLMWECDEDMSYEHKMWPEPLVGNVESSRFDVLVSHLQSPMQATRHWMRHIASYTSTSVTVEEDKLYAIAGLASLMDEMAWQRLVPKKTTYAAGLWEHGFIRQLAWNMWCTERPDPPPSHYRAPSWSWASTNGAIFWTGLDFWTVGTELAKVADAGIQMLTKGTSPYGAAKSGSKVLLWGNLCAFGSCQNTPKNDDVFLDPIRGPDGSSWYRILPRIDGDEWTTKLAKIDDLDWAERIKRFPEHDILLMYLSSSKSPPIQMVGPLHWDYRATSHLADFKNLFFMPLLLDADPNNLRSPASNGADERMDENAEAVAPQGSSILKDGEVTSVTQAETQTISDVCKDNETPIYLSDSAIFSKHKPIKRPSGEGTAIFAGLILEPVSSRRGCYRRLGSVSLRGKEKLDGPDPIALIAEAIRASRLPMDSVLETSKDDPHVHLIELV